MSAITNFKTNFDGGMRSNRFYINGTIPFSGNKGFTKFHIRATQIPQLSTKTMSYDYFGRKYHYPGEKDYGTWSFTVLDDTTDSGNLWKFFHNWQENINSNFNNQTLLAEAAYKANSWEIHHLTLDGEDDTSAKVFVMHGCWPTAVQPISFSMTNPNNLNSFNVIMVYDYIELRNGSGASITASNVQSTPGTGTTTTNL